MILWNGNFIKLDEKQELFMRLLPRLIDKAHKLGLFNRYVADNIVNNLTIDVSVSISNYKY